MDSVVYAMGFQRIGHTEWLKKKKERKKMQKIPLEVHWLGLHALSAEGLGLISDWGTEIPQAEQCDQKEKKKKKALSILCKSLG